MLFCPANKLIEKWKEEESRTTNFLSLIESEQESLPQIIHLQLKTLRELVSSSGPPSSLTPTTSWVGN